MKTAIISVGTELLMGQTVNTNAVYLSRALNDLGHDVLYHYTAGDNPDRLTELIRMAYQDCDLVITTGGLGPTQDDLTKEMVCRVHGDELVRHQESYDRLTDLFKKQGWDITENNYKQCDMPSRATVLPNENGTAPGFILETDGRVAICMPGPPREMKAMFEQSVRPYLAEVSDGALCVRDIRCFGVGESRLETLLLPLIDGQTDPTFATYAKEGESFLRVASKAATAREAEERVEAVMPRVRQLIGEYIYSEEGEDLPQVVGNLLMERGVTVAVAESCTGGMFTAALVDIPGISAVLDRGIVTYSNRAKVEELDVSEETLKAFGAVSEETAGEMAAGLAKKTGCDLCISVTGVAGPEGGSEEKPVGTFYIGTCFRGETKVVCHRARNVGRQWNRNRAMLAMMHQVYRILESNR